MKSQRIRFILKGDETELTEEGCFFCGEYAVNIFIASKKNLNLCESHLQIIKDSFDDEST